MEDLYSSEVCMWCKAPYNMVHGVYDCGYPAADCPAMVAEAEAEYAEAMEEEFWTAGNDAILPIPEDRLPIVKPYIHCEDCHKTFPWDADRWAGVTACECGSAEYYIGKRS